MYVAVKGGAEAIANSLQLLAESRRGDPKVVELGVEQIREQLYLAVDRVMAEGALYDRELAALALKQACGDVQEAVFLLRAYRTTLPRYGYAHAVDTQAMAVRRRISATYKDLPGGQVLGPSFDYAQRLLDFQLLADGQAPEAPEDPEDPVAEEMPGVLQHLDRDGLIEPSPKDEGTANPADVTRESVTYPADRDNWLQMLARGDEGYLLSLAYSTQRGYGRNHPFVGEIRLGEVAVCFVPEELGLEVEIADVTLTECQMINQFQGSECAPPRFTRGYGLTFGHNERKAMSMALVDRALRSQELGEEIVAPAQDQEFVLSHSDSVEASGFVQHLKLPHYVDFQSELMMLRDLRRRFHDKQQTRGAAE